MNPLAQVRNQCLTLLLCLIATAGIWGQEPERPNIIWLVTEDNSQHFLKLYNKNGAAMPNIERLARQGIVFERAFSQAAVCSVARSTIISGCYAPRIGAQYHRRTQLAPMPEGLEMFPTYLRRAGYYTSNNSKEDYNLVKGKQVWDESSNQASYRKRQPGQPFFHVQNFGITHEGQLHFAKADLKKAPTQWDPATISPFPYHPNTALFRYTYARYLDLHRKADEAIGQFIAQLEEEGLMENTFIFYYGDHGGVLPRSKGYIYESGLHVPLVVYVPEKWRHLVPYPPGSRTQTFVQFADLGPTVLRLAGLGVPEQMDGQPFLGAGLKYSDWAARTTSFSYADRFDEKYDLVRALRKGKYKYIRNYQPFNIDALFNFYRYKMAAYQEWWNLAETGQLNPAQMQFFQSRAPEALYDVESDPHELNNLAADPNHQEQLTALRIDLQQQLLSMPDLSFFPEPYFLEEGIHNPVQFGQEHQQEIGELMAIADLSLLPFAEARKEIKKALRDRNPWKRYWGLIACTTFGEEAARFYKQARKIARKDPENLVRMRAIEFLALNEQAFEVSWIPELVSAAESETEANLMLNSVALIRMVRPELAINIPRSAVPVEWIEREQDLVNRRLDFINQ
ncbi:MAG TPA: sulfatase-like hydrolase/transferase [Saprospiraceae bacterium]|nr:sulfatase-like hydrolase/transferase [Saprospiraceae bacterium]